MEAGQTIAGKYCLNRLLGTGGMASVWSAINVFTEREFAMKFMLPQVARTPEAARRFLLEARVSARINHPNIIEVIDVGQAEDGSLFLVMELLNGVSLEVAVRRQRPRMLVGQFMAHMRDVAQALAAAHRSGVIHRDLKPTNIFLHEDRDGRVVPKILDFGVSKILEEENNTSLTVVGTILGSPLYMSPEQAMGAAGIDGRTDVWAFGSILYEALSGKRAYDAPNFNALIVTIATTQPRPVEAVAPHLPEPIRTLIRDCLVTDKARRIQSFDEIVERLDAMLPELQAASQRLPVHDRTDVPSDAEATTALPGRRTSDRPPPPPPPTEPAPPGYSEQAIAADETLQLAAPASTTTMRTYVGSRQLLRAAQTRAKAARAWMRALPTRSSVAFAGAAGLAVVGGAVAVASAFARGGPTSRAAIEASAVSAATGEAPPPRIAQAPARPAESSDVPVISVDSLPIATGHATPAHASGRLSVVASPGRCTVSVDGVPRGMSPLPWFEIGAGPHRIDCSAPNGRSKTANVTVMEGATARYAFALDE